MTFEVRTAKNPASSVMQRVLTAAVPAVLLIPALALVPSAVAQTPSTPAFISVAPGGSVFDAAISPDGTNVWVTNTQAGASTGQVTLVGVSTQAVGASLPVGVFPTDIAFNNSGKVAFVNNGSSSSISTVNVPNFTVKSTVDLSSTPGGIFPYGLAYNAEHLFITNAAGNSVPEYLFSNPDLTPIKNFKLTGPSGRPVIEKLGRCADQVLVPVFSADASSLSGGHPKLDIISPATGEVVEYLSLNTNESYPEAVAVSSDGKFAYVALFDQVGGGQGGVWVINLTTLKTVTVIATGADANTAVAISADNQFLLVTGYFENQLALISTATDTVTYVIAAGAGPNSVTISSDGSQAFFANQNDGTLGQVSFTPAL